jgi:hypothetical protein
MDVKPYFFDTYALRELIKGGENYKGFVDAIIITTIFNLMELHYGLLKDHTKEIANHYFNYFRKFVILVDDETIKQANEFRYKYKKLGLSYIDCVGYTFARSRNIKFLTGDNAFKGMEGVEFVK